MLKNALDSNGLARDVRNSSYVVHKEMTARMPMIAGAMQQWSALRN